MPDKPRDLLGSFLFRLTASGYYLLFFVLLASMFVGFAFESRVAAFLVLHALAATLAVRTAVALLDYRHVMRREWPKVEPLDDDDW